MDWVHAEAAPRFPDEVAPLRPVESAPDSASSVLSPAQQRALPELDAGWATQGGSSQGLGWQAPSSNLAGWQAGAGSPREADVGSGNAPPAGLASGLAGKVDVSNAQLPSPPSAGSPAGSLSLLPAAAAPTPPQGGVAPRLSGPSSYSSVAVFGPADGGVGAISVMGEQSVAASSTVAAAAAAVAASTATATTASAAGVVSNRGVIGATQEQQQQQLLGIGGSASPAHATAASPSSGATPANAAATAAAAAGRPTPKKKPRGPRAPKKKPKPPMAPVRRAVKVKKPRPPEVPLGANGRERAMGLLRLLVGSPLSEEFRRPVVQLHPELAQRYTLVVRRPIDLATVARRLRRGAYDNAAGRLRRDTVRIFRNCEKFNIGTSQLFVGIARHLRALFESQWAEADLPVPGESRTAALRRRAALRSVRYRLGWRTQLRGPLREAARQAVKAASAAALAAGGAGATSVAREFSEDILPQLSGDGEPSDDEWTLGLFAERACLALGLRAHQPPPPSRDDDNASSSSSSSSSSGNGGVDEAIASVIGLGSIGASLALNNSGSEKAGRDACADWLFGPRQSAWLAAETAAAAAAVRTPAQQPAMVVADASVVMAAWLALDKVLSPATVLLAFHASRGTEYSSVWARPDKLVWAKQAKNFYWPAMLLWGSGTSTALKEVNIGRVPPAFRDELEKQAKGNNRGGAVVEFFGAHEFALLKPDALKPLSTLDKCPNKSISKNKRWEPTMQEARHAVVGLLGLDAAMYQAQPELPPFLEMILSPSSEETEAAGTDTDTSSGESVLGSDTESSDIAYTALPPTGSAAAVVSPYPAGVGVGAGAGTAGTAAAGAAAAAGGAAVVAAGSAQAAESSGGASSSSSAAMSPPPPPRPNFSIVFSAGGIGGTGAAGAAAVRPNSSPSAAKAGGGGGAKRKRKPSDESKRGPDGAPGGGGGGGGGGGKKKLAVGGSAASMSALALAAAPGGAGGAPETFGSGAIGLGRDLTSKGPAQAGAGGLATAEAAAGAGDGVVGGGVAGGEGGVGLDGMPAWRLALKRPRHELTPKERALEKVSRYLDKFGDMFLRPAQRKVLAAAREKAALLKDRGAPSAPVAPAAVLGQTGLWGRLMGGPDTAKVHSEETESTDGEDEDVGMIDSEGPKTKAERKAALRRQQQVLREDIENLHARAIRQEKRLKGLGATIPPHAVMQAKRDREWREFLERRTGDPSGVATVRKEKHRFGDERDRNASSVIAGATKPEPDGAKPKTISAPAPSPAHPEVASAAAAGGGAGGAAPKPPPSTATALKVAGTEKSVGQAAKAAAIGGIGVGGGGGGVATVTSVAGSALASPSAASGSSSSRAERPERASGTSSGRAYGSSSFRGVNLNGNRWLARISQDGKKKSLGGYATETEAAKAYDRAALQLFGPSAVTNFRDGKRVHPERGSSKGGSSGAGRSCKANSDRGAGQAARVKPPTPPQTVASPTTTPSVLTPPTPPPNLSLPTPTPTLAPPTPTPALAQPTPTVASPTSAPATPTLAAMPVVTPLTPVRAPPTPTSAQLTPTPTLAPTAPPPTLAPPTPTLTSPTPTQTPPAPPTTTQAPPTPTPKPALTSVLPPPPTQPSRTPIQAPPTQTPVTPVEASPTPEPWTPVQALLTPMAAASASPAPVVGPVINGVRAVERPRSGSGGSTSGSLTPSKKRNATQGKGASPPAAKRAAGASTPPGFKGNPATRDLMVDDAAAAKANGTATPAACPSQDVPEVRSVFAAPEMNHSRAVAESVVDEDRVVPARQQPTDVLPPISSLTAHQPLPLAVADSPAELRSLLSRHRVAPEAEPPLRVEVHSPVATPARVSARSPALAPTPAPPAPVAAAAAAAAAVAPAAECVDPAATTDEEENGRITVESRGRDGPQASSPQAEPLTPEAGYAQIFAAHSAPVSAAYSHPGYAAAAAAATVNSEGTIWPGSPGRPPHPGFGAYNGGAVSATTAYGYPYSPSTGYGQTPHAAAPVLTGNEGLAGRGGLVHPAAAASVATAAPVAAAQRGGQSPLPARNPGGSGYVAGASSPVGGVHSYGVYGAHTAFLRGQGSRSSSKESVTSPASGRSSGELSPSGKALTQAQDDGGGGLGFDDDGGRSSGHVISVVGRDGDRQQQQQQKLQLQQQVSTSPRGSSLMKASINTNSSPVPDPDYPPSAVRNMQHGRHSYAHNAHMHTQAAAVQSASAVPAAGAGERGGGERLVYNHHHHPAGGLYAQDARMSQQQQYQRGGGLQVEALSPTAGGARGIGVEAVTAVQHQQQVQGLAIAAQQGAYEYRMSARFDSHAQAQQHAGGVVEGHGALGQTSGAAVPPTSTLASSAAIPEQGW